MATRRIFWGFCRNRFGIGSFTTFRAVPIFAEIFVIEKRLPDSPISRVGESPSFSFKHSKADSLTRRVGELSTPRLAESESQRLPDSLSRGVVFRLRISPRIRSQKRNGSKGSVRDPWGPNFCKNPRKSASLPCPYNIAKSLSHAI